jgi:CRP-like cAMP-binding protein
LKKKHFTDLAILGEGEFVGELELYEFDARICSALCVTDCKVFELSYEAIFGQIKWGPFERYLKERIEVRLRSRL